MSPLQLDRLLVPIANEEDAVATSEAFVTHFGEYDATRPLTIVLTHVIEKGGGAPDKAPLEARQEQAEQTFHIASQRLEQAGYDVDTHLAYGGDVVEAITDSVAEANADAIVFRPRETGLLTRLLTGNRPSQLVSATTVPVIALPDRSV